MFALLEEEHEDGDVEEEIEALGGDDGPGRRHPVGREGIFNLLLLVDRFAEIA